MAPSSSGIAMSRPQVPRHQHPEGGDTITAMLLIWPSRVVKSKELLALTFLNESNKNIVMNNICNCPNGRSIMDVCIACWRAKRLPYQCTQHLYLLKLIQGADYLYIRKVKVQV